MSFSLPDDLLGVRLAEPISNDGPGWGPLNQDSPVMKTEDRPGEAA
jgi:hypothetical protein